MTTQHDKPAEIPAPNDGDASQIAMLLDAAKDVLGEEIGRTDRLESRARHMITACGVLFTVAMATTAGILNALLNADKGHPLPGWVVPVLGGTALASVLALVIALALTLKVQNLRGTNALPAKRLKDYISWAEKGHPAVGRNLITSYADALDTRRTQNNARAKDLRCATYACAFSAAASSAQLGAVLVALLTR